MTAASPTATVTGRPDPRDPLIRLGMLLDDGSLEVLRPQAGTGVLAVRGLAGGHPLTAFITDPRTQGGALGWDGCDAMVVATRAAVDAGCPVVGIWHSGGARLQEGVGSLDGVGRVFHAMVEASGKVPQLSVVLGPAAGGAAYGPALTDIVLMGPGGRVFVTGPDVVRSVTGEDVDMPRLGGPEPHGRRSGVAHVITDTDAEAFDTVRSLVDLFSAQGHCDLASVPDDEGLRDILPAQRNRAYDVRPLVARVLDAPGVELQPLWAPNVVTVLGRLAGRTVGVIADNPLRLGGCLDASSAEKAARFVRMCDGFGVPLVVLVDVPGYLPGLAQEWGGVVRRGAKLLHAFSEAVVPRVTVVLRKAFGGAYIAMNAACLGATRVFAWPDAEVAVMGARAAVEILHRKRLSSVEPANRDQLLSELADEHARLAGGLDRAQQLRVVQEVIDPATTRAAIARVLAVAPDVRGRHGNIPL